MQTVKKCPVCGSGASRVLFSAGDFPYFTIPVNADDKVDILGKYGDKALRGELVPVICVACSHVYLRKRPDGKIMSDLYARYYSYPSALEGGFKPERDDSFLKVFNNRLRKRIKKGQGQDSVLEIGCYDGYVLYNLKKERFQVTGCDPSEGASIGKRFGIDIKNRFFNARDFLREGLRYDVIIFRHLLEHVPDPVRFLKDAKKILAQGGMFIFEIPNVEFYLRNQNTSVFSFQHLQYFSRHSVSRLLKEAGLKASDIIADKENLIAACSEGKNEAIKNNGKILELSSSFRDGIEDKKMIFNRLIKRFLAKGVVLWGAGTFCSNVFSIYGLPRHAVSFIVDSDRKKWDMEFLDHGFKIRSPEALREDQREGLIVCSMYADQIMERLKEMKYDRPVIKMHPRITLHRKGD